MQERIKDTVTYTRAVQLKLQQKKLEAVKRGIKARELSKGRLIEYLVESPEFHEIIDRAICQAVGGEN